MRRVTQEDPWAKIPHWVVTHPDIEATAVRIYAVLSKHANSDREAFPSIARLAAQAHLARSTAQAAIHALEAIGAVEVTRIRDGKKGWLANRYHLPLTQPPLPDHRAGPSPTIATPMPDETATPSPTIATEQEPLLTRSTEQDSAEPEIRPVPVPSKLPAKAREPNPWWDALAAVFGYQPENGEQKVWGQFVKARADEETDPAEIPIRAQRLLQQWGAKALTVPSLHKHWRRFGTPIGSADQVDVDAALDGFRRARRREAIIAADPAKVLDIPPPPRHNGQADTEEET